MLILLDIDGVLVPANSWRKPEFMDDGFAMFNARATKAFQKILSETNADVVLTTSHKGKYNISQWRGLFGLRGINPNKISSLDSDSLQINRKQEILHWYATQYNPDEGFVILDDDKTLNSLPPHIKDNLILTSPSVGLTDELADEAISILKKSDLHLNAQ